MKFQVQNLGALRQAEFELGNLTIICGQNNSGKTYATYALYGFLSFWHEMFSFKPSSTLLEPLMSDGVVRLSIGTLIQDSSQMFADICNQYTKLLPGVFASQERNFENTKFNVSISNSEIVPLESFERVMGSPREQILRIHKPPLADEIIVSLLVDKENPSVDKDTIGDAIGQAIKAIVYDSLFPKPFIASAERTGAAIFRTELNFARNRLLEQMGSMKRDLNPIELLNKVYTDYALPVRANVDFTRQFTGVA